MITIQDWIATIPEEERLIAFVGEHQTVTRTFLVTGKDWQKYQDWGFHLDMAFDLSSVTSREERAVESTTVSTTEQVTETQVKTTGNTQKERYTVADTQVDCAAETDVASLSKEVLADGVRLTWTVLRQHTQLPGKLRATLRALGPDGQVKKSERMLFEVEPAVVADPAADIPQSEFEAMEEHMDEMLDAVLKKAQMVDFRLQDLEKAIQGVEEIHNTIKTAEDRVNIFHNQVIAANEKAQNAANTAGKEADRVLIDWPGADEGFDLQYGNNLLNMNQVTFNKGQLANGLIGNDSSRHLSLTGYIQVKEGDVLCYQRTDPDTQQRVYGNLYAVCLFDQWKEVNFEANQYKADENGVLHEITIPAGVSYVRLTLHHLDTAVDPAIAPCHELIPYERFWTVRKLKPEGYDAAPIKAFASQLADTFLNQESENPIQNRVVTDEIIFIKGMIDTVKNDINLLEKQVQYVNTNVVTLGPAVELLQSTVGDIDAALDDILALQDGLMGGDGA